MVNPPVKTPAPILTVDITSLWRLPVPIFHGDIALVEIGIHLYNGHTPETVEAKLVNTARAVKFC